MKNKELLATAKAMAEGPYKPISNYWAADRILELIERNHKERIMWTIVLTVICLIAAGFALYYAFQGPS